MPKSALIQPDSISVKGQMHDIGGQKLGPVLADIFYSPLILRYLGEFSVEELRAVEMTQYRECVGTGAAGAQTRISLGNT